MTNLRIAALFALSLLGLVSFGSSSAAAQALSPAEAAIADTQGSAAREEVLFDGAELTSPRLTRARRFRVAGISMLAVTLTGLTAGFLFGAVRGADPEEGDNIPVLMTAAVAMSMTPVLVTGTALVIRGRRLARSERRRLGLHARGAGLALTF